MERIANLMKNHASALILPAVVGVVGAIGIGCAMKFRQVPKLEKDDFTYRKSLSGPAVSLCLKGGPVNGACLVSRGRIPDVKLVK